MREVDLSSQLSRPLHRLVNCHADALRVPEEFILYPLITSVAACIGVNRHIHINPTWVEPSTLLLIVAAKKGERKQPPFESFGDHLNDCKMKSLRNGKKISLTTNHGHHCNCWSTTSVLKSCIAF